MIIFVIQALWIYMMRDNNKLNVKIKYEMNNVTYDDCGHTFESFFAFQGINEWKTREHLVFYEAQMKRKDKRTIMPNSPHWRLTAKVILVDTPQLPKSKNTIFDDITEAEARFWLKLFQEQSKRLTAFKKEYYNDGKDNEVSPPTLYRYINKRNKPVLSKRVRQKDPFIKNSIDLQDNHTNVSPFPYIMMTEQVLAAREYDSKLPNKPVIEDDIEEIDDFVYDPRETADWNALVKGLSPETAKIVTEELKKSETVTQIFCTYALKTNSYLLKNDLALKDGRRRIKPAFESENKFEFFYFTGTDMVKFFTTDSCVEAVNIGMNAQKAFISPAQKAVKAHEVIKDTYSCHFKNFAHVAESIDDRNKLINQGFGFN